MYQGFKIVGLSQIKPGDWYLGLKKVSSGYVTTPQLCEDGDIFVVGATMIKLEKDPESTPVPSVLRAPYLAADPDGRWFAWWFEPILEKDEESGEEYWACDAPADIPGSQVRAALDVLQYYIDMDISRLPEVTDWRESKSVNPWYAAK
jgi:hypothetical protein